MKITLFTAISALFIFCAAANLSKPATLEITLNGAVSKKGYIVLGLYDDEKNFAKAGKQFRQAKVLPEKDTVTVTLTDVPAGSYGVAVYQDINDNGMLDKNFLGKPTEPVGFSNNVQSAFGPPKFKPALITLVEPGSTISIVLRK